MIQLIVSTLLSIVGIYIAAQWIDDGFEYGNILSVKRMHLFLITSFGLINGFFIGMITNYYTSYEY